MAAAQPVFKKGHLNFVHNDEIWKDHVRHECTSQRQKWPERWGYLIQEYHSMSSQLSGKPGKIRTPPSVTSVGNTKLNVVKLPPINTRPKEGFPLTTTQQIGWKSTKKDCQLELYGRYGPGPKSRGQCGILKLLKWPQEGAP